MVGTHFENLSTNSVKFNVCDHFGTLCIKLLVKAFSFVQVEIRPMMYVALTYDHRLVDGREAVTFLRKIKQNVEDPTVMFLDI